MFKLIFEVGIYKIVRAGFAEIYRKLWLEMCINSFSQDKEDLIIEKLIKTSNGFYLEIGGYHPTRLSNTYRLYRKGWSGVVVEPNPQMSELFRKIRPNDRLVEAGVGTRDATMTYYKYLIPALNTFSKEQVLINEENGYRVNSKTPIKILPINKLLKKYVADNHIDLLSLDVEGWDEAILKKWNWKWKPAIICVETENKSNKIEKYLIKSGYNLKIRTKHNSIFSLID